MKLTKSQLRRIIKEELALVVEKGFGEGAPPSGEFYKKQEVVLEEDEEEISTPNDKFTIPVPHPNTPSSRSKLSKSKGSESAQKRSVISEEEENNPWAICTSKVGREDKAKYERCVKAVKAQNNP